MQYNIRLGLAGVALAGMMLAGCGSSNSTTDNNTMANRFTKMTMMGDTVEQDNQTKLEWVGSAGAMGNACQPHAAATTEEADIASAQAHCDALEFASHTDWRVATPEEEAEFIKDMKEAGLTPFYQNPSCPRLIGVDGNGKAKAVNTHNSNPVGEMTPWATLITQDSKNFGVKCVRAF